MRIEPNELRIGKRFRHDDGGNAVPASDIRHGGAAAQPLLNTLEGGYPVLTYIGFIAWSKKTLYPAKETTAMSSPGKSLSGTEALGDERLVVVNRGNGTQSPLN